MRDYTALFYVDVIIYPCPKLDTGFAYQGNKDVNGMV